MDCSPPGFAVHGILQARILEWVAIPPQITTNSIAALSKVCPPPCPRHLVGQGRSSYLLNLKGLARSQTPASMTDEKVLAHPTQSDLIPFPFSLSGEGNGVEPPCTRRSLAQG